MSLFSTHNPSLQLYWDAHSISTLQSCPRRYQYQILQQYTTAGAALDLDFGIAYHDILAKTDLAKHNGADHTQALILAAELAMDRDEFVGANNYKNRFTLTRSVLWNLDHFRESREKAVIVDDRPAIEINFSFQLDFTAYTGEAFGLCGYMDSIVETALGIAVRERKTTKTTINDDFFQRFSPNTQVSIYCYASQVILSTPARGVEVEACQTAVNFSDFGRRIFIKTPAQLEELERELRYWISQAEKFAREKFWPKNENNCFLCPFKKVCRKDPNVRDAFLEDPSEFRKREWNPLEPR
jgi:hypothetical protein